MGLDLICEFERWTENGWVYLPVWEQESPELFDTAALSISHDYDFFGLLGRDYLSVPPIALKRGLPTDATAEVRAIWEGLKDDPSITNLSWVTLDELVDYDWDTEFYGSIYSLQEGESRSARVAASDFLTRTLPYLQTLVSDPRCLRMVFWFGC
ncbi:hypothetical protein ACINK0_02930 [Deinococcus sp. VB343]|uniref:hypothetical protein n=1 Tax=Deinococcus sp. VB343 TaxID=3385567 RepID=UPI0039C8DD1A